MDLIIHTTTNNPSTDRNEVFNFSQIANLRTHNNAANAGHQAKKRKDNIYNIARECVNK